MAAKEFLPTWRAYFITHKHACHANVDFIFHFRQSTPCYARAARSSRGFRSVAIAIVSGQ